MSIEKKKTSEFDDIKIPSDELMELIKEACTHLINFTKSWTKVEEKGKEEGIPRDELIAHAKPYLKKAGLTRDQIYYLENREEEKQRTKNNRNNAEIPQNDDKNELEDSSTSEVPNISPDVTTYTSRLTGNAGGYEEKTDQPILKPHSEPPNQKQKIAAELMEDKGFNLSDMESTQVFKCSTTKKMQSKVYDIVEESAWILVIQKVIPKEEEEILGK